MLSRMSNIPRELPKLRLHVMVIRIYLPHNFSFQRERRMERLRSISVPSTFTSTIAIIQPFSFTNCYKHTLKEETRRWTIFLTVLLFFFINSPCDKAKQNHRSESFISEMLLCVSGDVSSQLVLCRLNARFLNILLLLLVLLSPHYEQQNDVPRLSSTQK